MVDHNPKTALQQAGSGKSAGPVPIFSARLFPHRSLGHRGFYLLMGSLSIIFMGLGALFWSIGAWPVFGFFGLDLLAVYAAFKLNYRAGKAYEEISISRTEMIIRKCPASGSCKSWRFNPLWSRFDVCRHDAIGITRMEIASRKIRLRVGDFLNPNDRESFAEAFGEALLLAKR